MALSGMITSLTVSANPGFRFSLAGAGDGDGLGCRLVIGVLVAYFKILPIIATLGLMNILRGMTYLISKGKWVSAYQMSAGFKNLSTGTTLGISNLILFAVIIYILYAYFINQTKTGRYIYAVGSSPETAELIGIKRKRIVLLVYALMGLLAGLAGVLWVSKYASAQGDTAVGYEMNVPFAAVECWRSERRGRTGQGLGHSPGLDPVRDSGERPAAHQYLAVLAAVHSGPRDSGGHHLECALAAPERQACA